VSIEKRDYVRQSITVEAVGHQFEMTRLSAADWVAMRRLDKAAFNAAMTEAALAAIVDSSLPDGAALDIDEGIELMSAWVKAHKEDAVPPA
jgi:hypothetical protein